jgi:AraC-like DNA-binding protein
MRSVALKDAGINEFWASTRVSTETIGTQEQDEVRIYVGLRGVLALNEPDGHGGNISITQGTCFLHHCTRENHFRTAPETAARIFVLPADDLRHLLGRRSRTGPASAPMARILMSHADMLQRTVGRLGPDEARAARNALIELAKGVMLGQFDDREPVHVPALVHAARKVADARLTDAELSTATVAAHFHVSTRTLQRAFGGQGEPLSAYIRRRRLEEAAREFRRHGSRLTVSQAAAIWHFTDGSHFIRCFKKEFHMTPREFLSLHHTA